MTCLYPLSLLEAYIDSEMPAGETLVLEEHLKDCHRCQSEIESIKKLKKLLQNNRVKQPNAEYWDQTKDLILAKTVESDSWNKSASIQNIKTRSDFMRSLISVAASLMLLGSALLIGVKTDNNMAVIAQEGPVYALTPIEEKVDYDQTIIVSETEQINMIKGMLLMGAPGALGRMNNLYNLDQGNW